ncbi:hypothetical protein KW786_03750 [Candidatus Parcubacteria bacterium]|nr:hypothetical protein [Candidatus Parcubacteria bacterium]
MPKLSTNVGMYVGFLRETDGKLLLVRRTDPTSIIPGVSFKGNWELPGGAEEEADTINYNHAVHTAFAKAKAKVGIDVSEGDQPFLGPLYGTSFKGPQGYDLAQIVPFVTSTQPATGETLWVSPGELEVLALAFVSETTAKAQGLAQAEGLLSGKGKRMYQMGMAALAHHSPNSAYRQEAMVFLKACQ